MKREYNLLLISSIFTFVYILMNMMIYTAYNKSLSILDISLISISSFISVCYLIIYIKKYNLNKIKPLIFLFSIILFLMNIISGIIGFVVYSKLAKKEKRDLPELNINKKHHNLVYLLDLIICLYLMLFLPENISKEIAIISYIFMLLLNIIIFKDDLKRDFSYFKNYFTEYNFIVFKTYGVALAVLFILSLSIRLYTGLSTPTNQENITILLNHNILLTIFLATIYAPIVEELLFRGIFRKFIKNKYLYIILSGFIFGLLHVIDDYKSIGELLYIFVYGSLGCFLAWIYYKTNNIFTNIYMHFLQNTISIIAMLLIKFLV